jgi:hypothetical protein
MSDRKRITPEEVVAAYRATGLKPAQTDTLYTDESGALCGCAVGALWLANHSNCTNPIGENNSYGWGARKYGVQYFTDFYNGFDGIDGYIPETEHGFSDGRAAWSAVEREILGVTP